MEELFFSGAQTIEARYFNARILSIAEQTYSQSNRFYHNFDHIREMILKGKQFFNLSYKQYLAIIFHDFVYDPKSTINEELSAKQVFDVVQGLRGKMDFEELRYFGDVAIIIRDTKNHYYPTIEESKAVLDLDLERLARPIDEVKHFTNLIRQEYNFIDDKTFYDGRKDFYRQFLNIEHPFSTVVGRTVWEPQAKNNVKQLLNEMN